MPRTILLTIVFAVLCSAQTATTPLPSGFAAAGMSYNSKSTPQIGGWVSAAYLMTKTGGGTYNYSTSDITAVNGKATASMRTGVAQLLRQYRRGSISVLALAEVGVAASGSSTGAAVTVGGVGVWQPWRRQFSVLGAVRQLHTTVAGGQVVIEGGLGWAF